MNRVVANKLIAFVLGTCAIAYTAVAYRIPDHSIPQPVDSDAFPKILGFTLLALSVLLYFEKAGADAEPVATVSDLRRLSARRLRVVVTSAAVVIYALSLATAGFVICSWLMSGGLAALYGYRRHLVNAIATGSVVNGLYLLMTRALEVYLPNGPLPY